MRSRALFVAIVVISIYFSLVKVFGELKTHRAQQAQGSESETARINSDLDPKSIPDSVNKYDTNLTSNLNSNSTSNSNLLSGSNSTLNSELNSNFVDIENGLFYQEYLLKLKRAQSESEKKDILKSQLRSLQNLRQGIKRNAESIEINLDIFESALQQMIGMTYNNFSDCQYHRLILQSQLDPTGKDSLNLPALKQAFQTFDVFCPTR